MAGSIVRPGRVPFGTFLSVSLLFQINTVLCLVFQLMQPALEQGLTLGYSEQIITFPCMLDRCHTSPRDRVVFFSGSKNLSPYVSLAQTENFASLKSGGNEGRKGRQAKKQRQAKKIKAGS